MNKKNFVRFMKENKKSARTQTRYVTYVGTFEKYLSEKKRGNHLEETTPGDLKDFALWGDRELKGITLSC